MTTELKCVCRDPDPQGGYCQNCGESCVIKDCPFCGHSAALESVGVDHFVMCDGCCAESARWQSPTGEPGMAKRSAIAAWNRRAASPAALTDEPIADPAKCTALHVECHECTSCGHVGIDDVSGTNNACARCDWSGPSPQEDKCPGCGEEGTMVSACPKCGARYSLLAEARLAAPAPSASPAEYIKQLEKETSFAKTTLEATREAASGRNKGASPAALTETVEITKAEVLRVGVEVGLIDRVMDDGDYFTFADHEVMTPRLIKLIEAFRAAPAPASPQRCVTCGGAKVDADPLRTGTCDCPAPASPAALTSDDLTELGLFIASLRTTVRSGKKRAPVHQSDVDVLDSAYAALAASPADQVEDARDAARLDWMIDQEAYMENMSGWHRLVFVVGDSEEYQAESFRDPRAAIDAAMSKGDANG